MSPALELHIVQWLLLAATVTVAAWTVQYTMSAPWWEDQVGRTIMLKELILLVLLIPTCLVQVWPHLLTYTEVFWVESFVFGGIAAVMTWRSVVWWRIQRPRPRVMWRALRHHRRMQ